MPFDLNKAQEHLRNIGFDTESPEMKMLTNFAELTKPEAAYQPGWGDVGLQAVLAGGTAGLARLGGADHNSAVSQALGGVDRLAITNAKAKEAMQRWGDSNAELMLKVGMDQMARNRSLANAQMLYGGGDGPAGSLHSPDDTGVEVAPAPSGSDASVPSPGDIRPAPSAPGATSSVPPTAGTQPPAAPGGTPAPSSAINKYQIEGNPRIATLRTQLDRAMQMNAQGLIDDKVVDNIRGRLDQEIKLAEVQKSAAQNDPHLAAEIERAKLNAKANVEREQNARTTGIQSKGIVNMLQDLWNLPDQIGADKFDGYIGSIDAANPWGLRDMFGSAEGGRIRDKILGDVQAISVGMKKFVRGAGEGTWTDADQLGLERAIGDLIKSPNTAIFRERLSDVHNRISRAFTEPVGVDLPPIGDQQAEPGTGSGGSSAAAPKKPAVSKEQLSTMPVGSVFNGYKKTAGGWVPMTENDISDSMIPRP